VNLDRLPLGLITVDGLRLDLQPHRERLSATLAKIRPRLLVLDPLVRLHRGDENSSAEISELLGFLRSMQREHQVAIVLVHHVRKSAAGQPGRGPARVRRLEPVPAAQRREAGVARGAPVSAGAAAVRGGPGR
jgi:AAA domain